MLPLQGKLRYSASVTKATEEATVRHSDEVMLLVYLVPEREGLLFPEIEVLGVVVNELRFREPSSLHQAVTTIVE